MNIAAGKTIRAAATILTNQIRHLNISHVTILYLFWDLKGCGQNRIFSNSSIFLIPDQAVNKNE